MGTLDRDVSRGKNNNGVKFYRGITASLIHTRQRDARLSENARERGKRQGESPDIGNFLAA